MNTLAVEITDHRLGSRIAHRRKVDGTVNARRGEHRMHARITDISQGGCCLLTQTPLKPDAVIWISLPTIEPQMARVAWTKGLAAGCAFDQPLHPAILQSVTLAVAKAGSRA